MFKNSYHPKLFTHLFILGAAMLFAVVTSPIAEAAPFERGVSEGFEVMPQSLPDDRGLYGGSTTARYNNSPVNVSAGRVGDPLDDNRPHQYITLGGAAIDDQGGNRKCNDEGCYKTVFIKIYTRMHESKNLSFEFVDRRVNVGANGKADCSDSDLNLEYSSVDDPLPDKTDVDANSDCVLRVAKSKFPRSKLSEFKIKMGNGNLKSTGLYVGTVKITLKDSKTQSSFRITSSNSDVRFGYQGPNGTFGIDSNGDGVLEGGSLVTMEDYYVNFYGTKLADHHQFKFYWKPPCNVPRAEYMPGIVYDDINQGNPNVQPDQASLTRYRNGTQYLSTITNLDHGASIPFGDAPAGHPYKFEAVFNNINGGNGIGFAHNYDSVYYFMPCPSSYGWEVKNKTQNKLPYVSLERAALPTPPAASTKPSGYDGYDDDNRSDGGTTGLVYSGYGDVNCNARYTGQARTRCNTWNRYYADRQTAWNTNISRVKAALQRTDLGHYLSNISSYGQEGWIAASTQSRIQYKFKLAGGNDRNGHTGNGNSSWQNRYNDATYSNTTGAGVQNNPVRSRDNPVWHSNSNSTYREMMREPRGDGGADDSDMYCERAITVRSGDIGEPNGGDLESVRYNSSDGRFTDSVPQCVYLNVCEPGDAACNIDPCEPWTVSARAELRERGAVDWEYLGTANIEDAWVGITYDSWFVVRNNGQREVISPGITGTMYKYVMGDGAATSDGTMPGSPRALNRNNEYGFNKNEILVGAKDGGKTFVTYGDFSPAHSSGANNCNQDGTVTPSPETKLTVPYHYDITPHVEGVASSTEQGEPIEAGAEYTFPGMKDGRGTTWTDATQQYKITKIEYADGETVQNITARTGGADACAGVGTANCSVVRGPVRPADISDRSGDGGERDRIAGGGRFIPNRALNENAPNESLGDNLSVDTNALPVGTKVCFIVSISNPVDDADAATPNPDWRHSQMRCTTIIKKPKVQFQSGDLTVGRSTQDAAGACAGNANAIIQTARGRSNPALNQYGSWIEYGAFASGNINGFGSGGQSQAGYAGDTYKKLLFANTFTGATPANETPGSYTYGTKCLSNAFGVISANRTKANEIGNNDGIPLSANSTRIIVPGDYFSHPNRSSRTQDKTGYYTQPGENLVIGKPVAVDGGGPDAVADEEKLGGKYTVNYCQSANQALDSQWSFTSSPDQVSNKSNGCGGSGYVGTWLSAPRLQSSWTKWTYTAPTNTTVDRIEANRESKGGSGASYRGTTAYLSKGGAELENCSEYLGGCNTASDMTHGGGLNSSNLSFGTYCSVDRASSAIWWGNPDIGCPDYVQENDYWNGQAWVTKNSSTPATDTSYAMHNIRIQLNDLAAPQPNIVNSGLRNEGEIIGSGPTALTFSPTDGESGIVDGHYQIQYYNQGSWEDVVAKTEIKAGGVISKSITPTEIFGRGVIGTYRLRLIVWDKAGNQAAPAEWVKQVNTTSPLSGQYSWFKGRNIVMYAQSRTGDCSNPSDGGNITISSDIVYQTGGVDADDKPVYKSVSDLPRIMFLADCDITISNDVKQVDAWLVAKRDIYTCDADTYNKFKSNTITHQDCNEKLTVNGAVQADRLILMRTYGADSTINVPAAVDNGQGAAEVFNLRPDQLLSTWSRGQTSGVSRPIYEVDLPPRW